MAEICIVDSIKTITWEYVDVLGNVKIELSRDMVGK